MLPLNPYNRLPRLTYVTNQYYVLGGYHHLKVIPFFKGGISIAVKRRRGVSAYYYKKSVLKKLLKDFDIRIDIYSLDGIFNDPIESIPVIMVGNEVKFAHGFTNRNNVISLYKLISKVDGSMSSLDATYGFFRANNLSDVQGTPEHPDKLSIGFNKKTKEWYGWTHRGCYSYKVGSKVVEGDIAYHPNSSSALIAQIRSWYTDLYDKAIVSCMDRVSYRDYVETVINETFNPAKHQLSPTKYGVSVYFEANGHKEYRFVPYPDRWGMGEWTALILEDAKRMACDAVKGLE